MSQLLPLQLFKVLSDETRLNIVLLLREAGELCVCELVSTLEEPQPKVSRHLALLRDSQILSDRRDGKWIYYRLSLHMPVWANNIVEQAYQCQKDEVSALAGRIQHLTSSASGRVICI